MIYVVIALRPGFPEDSTFPGVQTAPLKAENGKVKLDQARVWHLDSAHD